MTVPQQEKIKLAYFSMEFGLHSDVPTYAGGLGMLAGDILRSCSDKEIPAVGVSLTYSQGFINQIINPDGSQDFDISEWNKADYFQELPHRVKVQIEGRDVEIKVWQYKLIGCHSYLVPVYLLDTDIEENQQIDRDITKQLYTPDWSMRLKQEIVLGVGGLRMLRALGYNEIENYHMNEGHAALLTLELLRERGFNDDEVRKSCIFTTHTPIPAGHDHFDYDMAYKIAGDILPWHIKNIATEANLSMTDLAMYMSRKTNAVSKKHQEVTQHMFPGKEINFITNGVHHLTWTSTPFKQLFDEYMPGWIHHPELLVRATTNIPDKPLIDTHQRNKVMLIDFVNTYLTEMFAQHFPITKEDLFDPKTLTITYGRRSVPYKRPLLIYQDLERLLKIAGGKLQIIHAGKCSPGDEFCLNSVDNIVDCSRDLRGKIKIAYLDNYNINLAKMMTAGSDIWLNTPQRPLEASGTSGMKAAMNGVINFSVLDGWWIEAMQNDPESGWSIGAEPVEVEAANTDDYDANDLYEKLENEIIPMFYEHKDKWIERMRHSIALGGIFNTHRCIDEYAEKLWN